jgi:hypothetical protein
VIDEGANPLSPEPISFGFRKVGVPDQKSVTIPRDGPRKQFIIGLIGGHGGRWDHLKTGEELYISRERGEKSDC